jgi:hypothetical protein
MAVEVIPNQSDDVTKTAAASDTTIFPFFSPAYIERLAFTHILGWSQVLQAKKIPLRAIDDQEARRRMMIPHTLSLHTAIDYIFCILTLAVLTKLDEQYLPTIPKYRSLAIIPNLAKYIVPNQIVENIENYYCYKNCTLPFFGAYFISLQNLRQRETPIRKQQRISVC